MRDNRIADANKKNIQINAEETGVIDLPLRDNEGRMHHLTDLKGKVVATKLPMLFRYQIRQNILCKCANCMTNTIRKD